MILVFLFVNTNRNDSENLGLSVLDRLRQLDIIGVSIFLPGIVMLLLALQWGGTEYAWNNSRIIGLLVGAILALILFAGTQIWAGDKGTLPPRLFKNRNVLLAILFSFFFGAGFFALVFYVGK